ncbi:hypothetical protein A9Q76_05775 [Arcobacter sp. 31_11_sub10_T18]|nr:hypothetical protein A9Q76_05775 [Arcobacter sp. 31_11_sub10_T18]
MSQLFSSLFLILLTISGYAKETLILSTGEWAPYTSQKDTSARVIQTIVTQSFKLANIDVLYKYYPWKRSLRNAENVEVDGSLPWSKSSEREEVFYYSKEPIIITRTVFFHLKSLDFKWDTFEDLKKYRIGGNIGYRSTDVLKRNDLKVELVAKEEQNFRKLLANRIDITPSSFFVGYYIINNLFPKSKAMTFTNTTKQLLPENGVHLVISKKHPKAKELMRIFDETFSKLVKSGMYDKIIDDSISK